MSDERLRRLERLAAGGDPQAAARLRAERIRRGIEAVPEVTYTILNVSLTALQRKVETFARRAARIPGAIPLSVRVTNGPYWHDDPGGSGRRVLLVDVAVEGDTPDLGDWELVSRLQHRASGTIIQSPPGGAVVEERELEHYRLRGADCTHCGTRRKRNDTFLLRHRPCAGAGCPECAPLRTAAGRREPVIDAHGYAQVGRSCLAAYSGIPYEVICKDCGVTSHAPSDEAKPRSCPRCGSRSITVRSPDAACLYAFDKGQALHETLASGELNDGAEPEWGVPLRAFFAACHATTRRHYGWQHHAWHQAARGTLADAEHLAFADELLKAAQTHLAAHIDELGDDGRLLLSDRDHNLAVIIGEGYTSLEHARLASTALAWYERHLREAQAARPLHERLIEAIESAGIVDAHAVNPQTLAFSPEALLSLLGDAAARERVLRAAVTATETTGGNGTTPTGDYLADEGSQGTWPLTCYRIYEYDNAFGRRAVVNFRDPDGRQAVWFTSAAAAGRLDTDTDYEVRGTVKRHDTDTYRGRNTPQTILTRCRCTERRSA